MYADNTTLIAEREVKGSEVKVTQLCLTLCDPIDYIVHGILQARTLEWVAISFSSYSALYASLDGKGVCGRMEHMYVWLSPFAVHLKLPQHC